MFTIVGADGKEYGPVTADQIRQWMAENRLTRDMQARRDGETAWQRLGDFSEFAPPADSSATTPVSPVVPPAGGATTPANVAANPAGPSPAVPATPSEPAAPLAPEPLVFTGKWDEYFKIWIVNVLLTIVTLGIYAAWAKVRKRRYFYANTRLFGHTFEYLADPVKILYGNLIVGAIFLTLQFSPLVSLYLYFAVALVFLVAVPWFIVRALMFNARNTAWRGLRFNFSGTYGPAAMVFLLWPLMVPFTFGLLMPVVVQKQKTFLVNRHSFGASPFAFNGSVEAFFKIYGVALLFFLPVILGYFAAIFAMVAAGMNRPPGFLPLPFGGIGPTEIVVIAAVLGVFLLATAGTVYLRSRVFNLVWNHTVIAGNRFVATMRMRDLFKLHLVNTLAIVFTLGLMYPWAAVRMAKFQLASVRVLPAGNVDAFVAAAQPPVGAMGEAASDFFDFDIGFGA